MSDIKLADDGDIDLTAGEMTLTEGLEAISQRYMQRLNFFFGEWFLDKSRGIPFIQQIFVKRPNPVVIDTIFKREILEDPSARELQEFELDLETATRLLTLSFRVRTEIGDIDFEEEFGL